MLHAIFLYLPTRICDNNKIRDEKFRSCAGRVRHFGTNCILFDGAIQVQNALTMIVNASVAQRQSKYDACISTMQSPTSIDPCQMNYILGACELRPFGDDQSTAARMNDSSIGNRATKPFLRQTVYNKTCFLHKERKTSQDTILTLLTPERSENPKFLREKHVIGTPCTGNELRSTTCRMFE